MSVVDLYLCYTKSLDQDELDIVNKYWDMGGDKIYPFKYRLDDLQVSFDFKNRLALSDFVANRVFISSNSQKFNCISCGKKNISSNRAGFLKLRKKPNEICDFCKQLEINRVVFEKLSFLESLVNLLNSYFENEDFPFLSYLNKVILASLIIDISRLPIKTTFVDLNISGNVDLDDRIIKGLFEAKRIIYFFESNLPPSHDIHNGLTRFIIDNKKFINKDILERYNALFSSSYDVGLYFLFPKSIGSFFEYKSILLNDVKFAEIKQVDIDSIEELVFSIKMHQAYLLLNISVSKHNVPVDKGIRLDAVLMGLVKKYPMPVVFNIINYQSERVAAKLHANKNTQFYIANKYLAQFIESYVGYLELNAKVPYSITLPDFMTVSKIEFFTSYYILGGLTNWNHLSGDEVVQKWIESPSVKLVL